MLSEAKEHGVLSGVRVLDLTDESGVYCTKQLAALGADVIVVEEPTGSPMRRLGPFFNDEIHLERSLHWFTFNLNKRSITLNLECADGQAIFRKLVQSADIVVVCFRPGHLASLGLAYDDMSAINPRIVVTSISPYGQTGPHCYYKASDMNIQAMGGLMYQCGGEDTPVQWGVPVAYSQAAAQAFLGTLMGYYHALATGIGQHVDVSVQECTLWAQKPSDLAWKAEGLIVTRGTDAPNLPRARHLKFFFQCKDGWIASMPTYWSHRQHLREWLNEEGLSDGLYGDEQLEGYFKGEGQWTPPKEVEDDILNRFATMVARYGKRCLAKEGQRRGMQVCPVNTAKDVLEDEQLEARDYFIQVEHPELSTTITYPGAPFKSTEKVWHLNRRAPLLGEHNEEIYIEELGMSRQELVALRTLGVV